MPNEKNSTEKHLLNYADVFADVVNVLVFHGKEVIDPKDLVSTEARSVLTLHGKTREQERDVVKIWTKGNTKIALVGLEICNSWQLLPIIIGFSMLRMKSTLGGQQI